MLLSMVCDIISTPERINAIICDVTHTGKQIISGVP